MKSIYELRNSFELKEAKTAITKADFKAHFIPTKEKVTFTFNGWDGKSYDGESRTAKVYKTDIEGYKNLRFVKVNQSLHYIDEKSLVEEKATGEKHPEAEWLVDVLRGA